MTEIEKLQKKVIEYQDAEIEKLRNEVADLKLALVKKHDSVPSTTLPHLTIDPFGPYIKFTTTSDNTK
jgi:hypothetical protein